MALLRSTRWVLTFQRRVVVLCTQISKFGPPTVRSLKMPDMIACDFQAHPFTKDFPRYQGNNQVVNLADVLLWKRRGVLPERDVNTALLYVLHANYSTKMSTSHFGLIVSLKIHHTGLSSKQYIQHCHNGGFSSSGWFLYADKSTRGRVSDSPLFRFCIKICPVKTPHRRGNEQT